MFGAMETPTTSRVARTPSSVLLSDDERRLIRSAAYRAETTLSDYVRRAALAQATADTTTESA